jgi:hypothetical protein
VPRGTPTASRDAGPACARPRIGAEKVGVVGDGGRDVGVGEAEAREEGEHAVEPGGGFEVRVASAP